MMANAKPKIYWMSLRERDARDAVERDAEHEFLEVPLATDLQTTRRGFLKAAGFSLASATVVSCSRPPVEKAIPFLIQPEEITPGVAYHYASTCGACGAGCGLVVKNRDGRPIKLEGNPEHPLSKGGVCAVGQASTLGLYDSLRLKEPAIAGKAASWEDVDRMIRAELDRIRQDGKAVRLLTGTINSPTVNWVLDEFLKQFSDSGHVAYDPLSSSAILDAHQRTHGVRAAPHFRFDRADVIVSLEADFLGTWISPVEFAAAYRSGRVLTGEPPRSSYHVQFESILTITGSKADERVRVAPADVASILAYVADRVARKAGRSIDLGGDRDPPVDTASLDRLATRLWDVRGRSLVVCGSQDVATQVVVNFVNDVLGNYGTTLDLERPSRQREGSERDLQKLMEELEAGSVGALLIAGVNPVYDLPFGDAFGKALQKVPLAVSFAERYDETASLARFVCPDHHYLESWGDAEPVAGVISVTQPVLRPLGQTRSLVESLAAWMGNPRPALEIMRESWSANVFPRRRQADATFDEFWDRAVHDGVVLVETPAVPNVAFDQATVRAPGLPLDRTAETLSLVLYPTVGMLDGRHAYNAWLQELPDPVSKVTWDNYVSVSPAAASKLGVVEGDVVRMERPRPNAASLELSVYVQPGQHDRVAAVALGYGRRGTDRFANVGPRWLHAHPGVGEHGLVGKAVTPWLELRDGTLRYAGTAVTLTRTGRVRPLACTQTHHTIAVPKHLAAPGGEIRPIVRETTLAALGQPAADQRPAEAAAHAELWPPDHPYPGRKWAMAIDLNACTGCSACVIACQVENNVPVVGRDEVARRREMHWIRIDRYYAEGGNDVEVVHQPMLCQHCENAPCEVVCPVLATVHSEEGLSQQIYNRCIGTRYCENNCPYKVRRFNWFHYPREDRLQNLVLNPDVVVRTRGVMEKCSFCVQRIQEAKIEAKRQGKPIADGAVLTACQQTCPAQAIVFGDANDPKSRVAALMKDRRHYHVLGELNVKPSVGYLSVVRQHPEQGKTS